jgi:uncharacterized protein
MRKILPAISGIITISVLPFAVLAQDLVKVDKVNPMTPEMLGKYENIRPEADFIKRIEMIPMRDGVKLYTVIVMKKGTKNAPILLSRTPYNAARMVSRNISQKITEIMPVMDAEFLNDGYIRIYQDIRGRNGSEGDFIMNRPIIGELNKTNIDESTDAYDTIDWLVKNLAESNGKVGITGSSYVGFTALVATINPHPALKASVPQSPMIDGWMGDDWFHNGAFRQPNFDYITSMTTDKGDNDEVPYGTGDDYLKFLSAGSAGDFAKKWGLMDFPFVRKWLENPAYNDFWSKQAVDKWLIDKPLKVPTMLVVGQWDQEDSYGAPKAYQVLEAKDKKNNMVSLVIGPWRHSQVNYDGSSLGALKFNGDTAKDFRVNYMKPFLDFHLKNGKNPNTPPVLTYETGTNKWNISQSWPMGEGKALYFAQNNSLDFNSPAQSGFEEYISDPKKPIPFVDRPVHTRDANVWKPWLVNDQRNFSSRPDVAVFETPELTEDLHIQGAPMVDLFASTTGTDGDFVVKLIDVYPDEETYNPQMAGYQLAVGLEIFRGRYVDGFDKPRALKENQAENFKFALPNVDHTFKKGHKIMVQVQSTLFPLYDRNPQKFVPNIFFAKPQDYQKANIKVNFGGASPSKIILPIVK